MLIDNLLFAITISATLADTSSSFTVPKCEATYLRKAAVPLDSFCFVSDTSLNIYFRELTNDSSTNLLCIKSSIADTPLTIEGFGGLKGGSGLFSLSAKRL